MDSGLPTSIQLSVAIIELHSALISILTPSHSNTAPFSSFSSPSPISNLIFYFPDKNNQHSSSGGTGDGSSTGYERRRAVRRIDGAISSLASQMSAMDDATATSADDDCASDHPGDNRLDETTMDDLVSVLTALPRVLLVHDPEEVVGTVRNLIVYMNASRLAYQLFIDHGTLPLHESHIDALLDRVGVLQSENSSPQTDDDNGLLYPDEEFASIRGLCSVVILLLPVEDMCEIRLGINQQSAML